VAEFGPAILPTALLSFCHDIVAADHLAPPLDLLLDEGPAGVRPAGSCAVRKTLMV